MARNVDIKLEFQWNGTDWTDETEYFMSASGAMEFTPPGEAFQVARQVIQQMQVVMSNKGLRFSIENVDGPLYANIGGGAIYQKKCRLQAKIDAGSFEDVFVGYIKIPSYDYVKNIVTFTVWDIGEILKQKFSTTMLTNYLEHDVVVYYLELAGLVDGTDFISPDYADANPGETETIEYSTTPIPFSWLDDEPIWSELVDLAQASGSRVYVDRNGLVHYEKTKLWATAYGTPETLTYTDMSALTPEYDDKAFFDAIMVEYTERVPGPSGEELWKLTKPKVIQAGKTENIIARFKYPAIAVDALAPNSTYYLTDINGADVTGSITPTLTAYAQQATLTITNSLAYAIVLSQASITGQGIHGQPTEQHLKEIDTPVYGRRIDIRGNPYLQSRLQAESVAEFVNWWYTTVKATYKVANVPGVPTRGIGKRNVLSWTDTVNAATRSVTTVVVRIDWQISILKTGAIAYAQNLTCLDDQLATGYFIIGTSTLSGSDKLWY